ncbi:glycosyl hydrolase [Mediterraneibacter massiliensis]|uniref:glycosyl hydrolase n=1 Tax=Mediterraneibacter massiliensis TaxID=1720300 RepID=UPI0024ADE218|nr:glycosyl hydrolase [Mediterraneibacter massiliensis]
MDWLKEFEDPGVFYRVKPFWFWNGDITEEGIEKQIKEMYEKGIGGFYLSPRQGQTVPYLSAKWFSLVKYACDRAKAYGLEAWLYDEYPYPSGMGGGEVLKLHPEAEHKILCHERFDAAGQTEISKEFENGDILYAKAFPVRNGAPDWDAGIDLTKDIGVLQTEEIYQITGLTMYNNKRFFSAGPQSVLSVILPEGEWTVEVFYQKPMGDFKFYGGYFDPCHKDAVETFIHLTHDAYKEALGGDLPAQVKGIFSDEVGMLSPIPWTDRLPEAFQERKGYSILENLPALSDPSWEGAYRIRYDLYDVIHQIFVESYHKQIADWCDAEGIQYCTEVPFMRLSTQRYSHIPGGDTAHEKAGRELEWIYEKYLCAFRYSANAVASLARQLGRKQCLIESFHSVGWTMTLQDAKWMLDRLAASGINLYVFHAFYYTIESIHKHDAPPSQFYQNPYWEHYRKLADYAARLSAYVTATEENTEIAVLDPLPSLWALLGNPFQGFPYMGESEEEKKQCDMLRDNWVFTTKTLLLHQFQFNHLDSEMLPDFVVENGKLKMGNAAYKIVVVPPALFYEKAAFMKLKEFVEAGGYMLFLGNLPYLSLDKETSDREAADMWLRLLNAYPQQVTFLEAEGSLQSAGIEAEFIKKVRTIAQEPLEVVLADEKERKNFITSIRKDEEGKLYLSLVNQGKRCAHAVIKNRAGTKFAVEELSMEEGTVKARGKLETEKTVEFHPYQSKYLCLKPVHEEKTETPEAPEKKKLVISTEQPFEVSLSGLNVYRLAKFSISRDGENWYQTEPMTLIEQAAAFPLLGKDDYKYESTFGTPKHIHMNLPLSVTYRTAFEMEEKTEWIELLLDRRAITGEWQIKINGKELDKEQFYHRFINDENNRLINITDYVKQGENILEVSVTAQKEEDGLRDPLYVLGKFGVSEKHTLTSLPKEAVFNSHYIKGFPYYSGKMTLKQKIVLHPEELPEEFVLSFDFGDSCMDCLEVKLNGESLGVRAFTPYQWNCRRAFVKQGYNEIELVRVNTLANMLDGTYFDYEKHELIHI